MPSDKSQDHLKNLGPAVKIMSVHTDLHSHNMQSFLGHCLTIRVVVQVLVQFPEIVYFVNYLETFYRTHNAAVNFNIPCQVTPGSKIICNPLGLNASRHNPHHCEEYMGMTALQCIIISIDGYCFSTQCPLSRMQLVWSTCKGKQKWFTEISKLKNAIHFTFINTLFSLRSYTCVGHMFTVLCSYAKLLLLRKQVMKLIKN